MKYANWDALAEIVSRAKPTSYLEIGVCEGYSLEVVLDHGAPDRLVLCDFWSPAYKGSAFRNHDHITSLLTRKQFAGNVAFLDGDSHELIRGVEETFDLIHIDGDHSSLGALWDLQDCWPKLNAGGSLVLDDLTHAPSVHAALRTFLEQQHGPISCTKVLDKPDGCAILRKI